MKIVKIDKEKITAEFSISEASAICFVATFVRGGVENDVEEVMAKIAGVLEGVLEENTKAKGGSDV